MTTTRVATGIDIGGTGIKVSRVDLDTGRLTSARDREPTPHPADPIHVISTVRRALEHLQADDNDLGDVGVGFPGVMCSHEAMTAAHLDPSWIGVDVAELLSSEIGRPVHVINDADAAGLAEMHYGAGRGVHGVVLTLTLGTGIGSALFSAGKLVPNTELGHLTIAGEEAEATAAASVLHQQQLSWESWAGRLDRFLRALDRLFWPDLIVLGGGVSEEFPRFSPYLSPRARVAPAVLGNDAGIIGAALCTERTRTS